MVQDPDVSSELPTAKELFFKTRVCKFYAAGRCKRGKNCTFAHGDTKVQPLPDFYKTRLCATLLRTGQCLNGDQCGYAHSKADIRDSAKPVAEAAKVAQVRATKAVRGINDRVEQNPGLQNLPRKIGFGPDAPFMSMPPTEDLLQPPASMLPPRVDRQTLIADTAMAALAEHISQVPFRTAPQMRQRQLPAQQPLQWQPPPRLSGVTAQSLAQSGMSDLEPDQLTLLAALLNRSKSIQSKVLENPGVLNNATLMSQIQALIEAHCGGPEVEPPHPLLEEPSRYEKVFGRTGTKAGYFQDVEPPPLLAEPGGYETLFGRTGLQQGEPMGRPNFAGMPSSYADKRAINSSGALPNSRQSGGGRSGLDMHMGDLRARSREGEMLSELSGLQRNRPTPEPTGIPLYDSPPAQQVPLPLPQDIPLLRERGLRISESMRYRAKAAAQGLQLGENTLPPRDKGNSLPSGLLVKNTFLEVGDSNAVKDLSHFAVQTAPELPWMYEEMSEVPLPNLGVHEDQGSTETQHLFDRASRSEQQGPMEPRRLNLHDTALGRPADRREKRTPSSSSLQEMVANSIPPVNSAEPAVNKHAIESLESLPNWPWQFSTGHRPGSAGDPHDDCDMDASPMEPPGMAPILADGLQFPAPPPGLTSLTRSVRAAVDVTDRSDLVRDSRPANNILQSDWKAPEPLPPELLEYAALKGSLGKGGPKGMGTPEVRWMEDQSSQQVPRRQAWEGNASGHSDLSLIVKNTFLEAATEEDQALAAALAQHTVRTAPELPLLSSWANL